jgi:hypothetical protein
MVGILLTCEQNCRISLRADVWAHKTSLIPSLFYGLARTKPGNDEIMYLCVSRIHFVSFYDFRNGFWSCSDSVVFCLFHLNRLETWHNGNKWVTCLLNSSTFQLKGSNMIAHDIALFKHRMKTFFSHEYESTTHKENRHNIMLIAAHIILKYRK